MGPARGLALGRLALPALLALLAAPAPGEARRLRDGEPGFGECGRFFLAGAPPAGPPFAARLCQRSGGAARFATLYSARHRAPALSAFRAPRPAPPAPRAARWLVEPQLDDPSSDLDEGVEEEVAAAAVKTLGSQQALAADYLDSDYEQGQLYPFSLSDDPQVATFALTNAVPMRPSFRDRWHGNLRGLLARALEPQCGGGEGLYLLVGAVPSAHMVRDRVAIPEFVWLAACCAAPGGGWAMGFVQHTRAGAVIEDVMLQDLEALLPSHPQLFQDNCAESEQDTEKMRRILEVVNQLQAEERAAQARDGPGPLSSTAAPTPAAQPPEASEEGGSFLGGLLGFLAAPVVGLLRLLYTLVAELLMGTLRLLWWLGQQVVLGLESGLCRLGTAAASYFLAIGEELLSIPWKLLKVLLKILRALLRILCCLLKATCRVLGLPARVLLDVAAFPLRTVAAMPLVCRDVAAGLGGALSLLLDMASGTVGGLLQVLLGVCRRIGYRAAWDSPGEF